MNDFKNGVKLAYFYTSAIIGAGFISGRETLEYFASSGVKGFYGILLASIIMGISGAITMFLAFKYKNKNSLDFLHTIFGKFLGSIVNYISFSFMLIIFSAMISGANVALSNISPINPYISRILFVFLCFICVIKKSEFICKLNAIICPIIIIGVIFISICIIAQLPHSYDFNTHKSKNWLIPCVCWCSYNIITIPNVLFSIKNSIKSKKSSFIGGFLSSILLFTISLFSLSTILLFYKNISFAEVPFLLLCEQLSKKAQYIYIIVFLSAVFTTAVSVCNASLKEISYIFKLNSNISAIIICLIGFILSFFGFSETIKNLYSIFGYIGLFIPILLIIHFIKNALF